MLCVKCGQDNPPGTKYCENCNAIIMGTLPESTTTSVVDVEEGQSYLTPEKDYECTWLAEFMFIVHQYLDGKADMEEVIDVYESLVKLYESYDGEKLPDFLNELDTHRHTELGKEHSRQLTYLMTKGFQLMNEGLQMAKEFIANPKNQESIYNALIKLQDCANQIGLAVEFMQLHKQILADEISRRDMESRADEFKARIEEKKAAAAKKPETTEEAGE
jgi:hypothetical protein